MIRGQIEGQWGLLCYLKIRKSRDEGYRVHMGELSDKGALQKG